jgi:SAM-dependent methyltransferase
MSRLTPAPLCVWQVNVSEIHRALDDAMFLNPTCGSEVLDVFTPRHAILRALRQALPEMSGELLDIGCGSMPYKPLVTGPPGRVTRYVGLDLAHSSYSRPDVEWDGRHMPLGDASVDCALATEVFEHCPDPEIVMREAHRVLKPGGVMFFSVPFLWPLHCVPNDAYRYTPFALDRHLKNAGFASVHIQALGGWDASLAQMMGLWVRRRWMSPWRRAILSRLAAPAVEWLVRHDDAPSDFERDGMITGLFGRAFKQPAEGM